MPSIAPVRLTAIVRFHASRVVSTMPWRAIVPALLTRICSFPKRANAAPTTSFQDSSSATSWRRNRTLPPWPVSRRARLSPAAASISARTTAASLRRHSSASAVPCPPAAPVISATFPVNRAISPPPVPRFARLLRFARNDNLRHCEEQRDEAISPDTSRSQGDYKYGDAASLYRPGVSRQPRRRQRGLDLWRAHQEHRRASSLSQHGADGGAALRRAASRPRRKEKPADLSDRMGRFHPPIFHRAALGCRPRCRT